MNFIKNKTKAIIAFGVVTLLGATTVATVPAFAETLNEAFPQPTFSANKNALTAPVGELHTIKTSNVALGKILQFMYANYLTEEEKTELQTFVDTCQNETNIEKAKEQKAKIIELEASYNQKKQEKIAADDAKRRAAEEAAAREQQAYQSQSYNQPSYNEEYYSSDGSSSAKDWIIQRESGGNYNATNGQYYGAYQLDKSYLNGDYSKENQDRTAEQYVANRYGSWEAAQEHWKAHGWY